ncbi:Hsp20/alpha crystallin family protein [Pseudoduganella aquatica]|uniref:Hsp20/alpha crystallin family protein n=1 Tax=Pseudoduganella aquatica TaxID=2660641 RepID=UPI001E395741|nr:Hsp20 family protein [Pseudoduganella aquatica]
MAHHHVTHFDPFRDLARTDPLRGVEDFFRDMGFKHVLRDMAGPPPIRLDVSENEHAYNVKAELPGVKKEDISVQIAGSQVSISAESRREHDEKKGETLLRSERYVGQQLRSFTLGQDVDEGKAQAKYHDGVLELTLPKRANGGAKKLPIN